MDTIHLTYFMAIAEQKSLAKAANQLFLSPSALSQYVTKIENDLKATLFRRTKGDWVLTEAGQVFHQMAQDILNREASGMKEINERINGIQGKISLGIVPGRGTELFSSIYPAFKQSYPDIRLSVVERNSRFLMEMIKQGKLDLAISTDTFQLPGLTVQPLLHERFVLAIPKSHPMAKFASDDVLVPTQIDPYRHEKFIMMMEGTSIRFNVNRILDQACIKPDVFFETTSIVTIINMINHGLGLSILPAVYATKQPHVAFMLLDPGTEWHMAAIHLENAFLTEGERALIELAAGYLAEKDRQRIPYMQGAECPVLDEETSAAS